MVVFQWFHLTKRINPSKRPNQWYLNGISIYCTSIIALRIFSCLCFLDMIPCLFLIRSPCLRCIVCEMLNSPNDQVWSTLCLGLSFFCFARACPFVPHFELRGYAWFCILKNFFVIMHIKGKCIME